MKIAHQIRKCHKCLQKTLITTYDEAGNIFEHCENCSYELWSPEKMDYECIKGKDKYWYCTKC